MNLALLEPAFYRYETRVEEYSVVDGDPATWRDRGCPSKKVTGPRRYRVPVPTLAEAQMVLFMCPKCFASGGGRVGCHSIEVSLADRGVSPEDATHNSKGEAVFWTAAGTGLADLSLAPSIQAEGDGCGVHIHITNGEVRNA